jgi:PleD family two-component response regulator
VSERVTTNSPAIILTAGVEEPSLASMLARDRYDVVHVPSGTLALKWARDLQPDAIVLDEELPDMAGIDACRLLSSDLRIRGKVPLLVLAPDEPSSAQRLSAIRAGAWDVLPRRDDYEELLLKLQTYIPRKQEADPAHGEGTVDTMTGLHSRPAFVRRARELSALMARKHGALACLVFALEVDPAEPKGQHLVAHTARVLRSTERVSDVIAALGPTEFAVLAPATDQAGAVTLARRVATALQRAVGDGDVADPVASLRVGYDAVANLRYSPIDPVDLLAHAKAALRSGQPEPGSPWVRRFDASVAPRQERVTAPRLHVG